MKVMKFGGTSVRDAGRMRQAAAIITKESTDPVVVISAMKGVTDDLIRSAQDAEQGGGLYRGLAENIVARHIDAAAELLAKQSTRAEVSRFITGLGGELLEILHGIELVRECTPRSLDLVMSFGERLSCRLMAAYLCAVGRPAEYVDAREVVLTDDNHGAAGVDFAASYERIGRRLAACRAIAVVTGFIGATAKGVTTTLGRNGSDYTASIVGAGLKAEAIEIWTDVDGVLSADPDCVPGAFVIESMSYEEAMEMSYFGAEVIHPYTIIPAVETSIPLRIKNTLNPSASGTVVCREPRPHGRPVTGIASIERAALIDVEGGGMVGIPGVASRIFSALAAVKVNVVMISQASSEHSICLVVRDHQADRALEALRAELCTEMRTRKIQDIELVRDLEIIAVIGENMRGTPGISGRLFSALGGAGVNVLAIAQGSSERNISFVVFGDEREKALNAVHAAFFGTDERRDCGAGGRSAGGLRTGAAS